jgi:membrane protease YdiL (CAAX protease family)
MMSNGLYHALMAIWAAQLPAPPSRAVGPDVSGDPLLHGLIAAGGCALVIWIVRRIARPEKLTLRRTPGRTNRLSPGHVLLVFAAYYLTPALILSGFSEGEPDYRWTLPAGMVGQLICLALSLLMAKLTFTHGLLRGLGLSMRHWVCDTGRGICGYLAVLPVCFALWLLVRWVWPTEDGDLHELLVLLPEVSQSWKLTIIASAVVLAPLAEEVFLRGLVQSMLRRYTAVPWLAILLTSVFFAGLHTSQPKDMPALLALGIALGYNYERCGRLWPSILMHALFNAGNILLVLRSGA